MIDAYHGGLPEQIQAAHAKQWMTPMQKVAQLRRRQTTTPTTAGVGGNLFS